MPGDGPKVIPTMRYHDARAAIDWLCRAFGFERQLVVEAEDGGIAHAQLTFRNGMVMLGTARGDAYGSLCRTPRELGGTTQGPYVVVEDADAHYARAKAAGAEMVMDIEDKAHGGRGYACRDPEGQLWNFGSYDPLPSTSAAH